MKKILFTIYHLLIISSCFAQFGKGLGIQTHAHIGAIFKHSPSILFDVEGLSSGLEINIINQKDGQKKWHRVFGFPKGGMSVFYYKVGAKELLGSGFGLVPNITFSIFKRPKLEFNFQMGWGIAYLNQPFNAVDNPINNAIGSHINSINAFKWYFGYQLNPQWQLNGGISFTHFSNGASQLPNLGINIPAVTLGTTFTPQPLKKEDFIHQTENNPITKKWGAQVHIDIAFRENPPFGGPKYPVYIASIAGTYYWNEAHQLSAGIDYEFNRSVYAFGLHSFGFTSKEEASRKSKRLAFFVGDELIFGNVGFLAQVGIYLPSYNYLVPRPIYTKLTIKYYAPPFGKRKSKVFLGVSLKAHRIVAEYFSFGAGFQF